jgi:hypothetical protein
VASATVAMSPAGRRRRVDRIVAGLLLALMAIGSLALWLLIPTAVLWGLAQVTTSASNHLVMGIAAVPIAMALFATLLIWLNALYLRVIGAYDRAADEEDEPRRIRGPLEPLMGWSLALAVVVAVVWLILHPIPQLSAGIG